MDKKKLLDAGTRKHGYLAGFNFSNPQFIIAAVL